jgi:hypothetical protein
MQDNLVSRRPQSLLFTKQTGEFRIVTPLRVIEDAIRFSLSRRFSGFPARSLTCDSPSDEFRNRQAKVNALESQSYLLFGEPLRLRLASGPSDLLNSQGPLFLKPAALRFFVCSSTELFFLIAACCRLRSQRGFSFSSRLDLGLRLLTRRRGFEQLERELFQ